MSALDGWIDVCRVGRWRGMDGRAVTLGEADLDGMVREQGVGDPAPVVVGHPGTDAPAYGWVDGLRRAGDRLQARLRDIDPSFRSAVEAGRYAGRSVALERGEEGGYRVRHVGFLGGAAPAVPGLSPTQFSGEADCVIELGAAELATGEDRWAWGTMARVLRRWREWLIEAHGVEKADGIVSEYDVKAVAEAQAQRESGAPPSTASLADQSTRTNTGQSTHKSGEDGSGAEFSGGLAAGGTMPGGASAIQAGGAAGPASSQGSEEGEMTERESRERADREQLAAEREALAAREAAFEARERLRAAETELAEHVKAGRVLPGEAPGLAALMASLPGDEEAELVFAAAQPGGGHVRMAPGAYLREFLSGLPERVIYRELAGPGRAPEGIGGKDPGEVARAAQALLAADESGELRIDQAVRQVLGERGEQGNV